LVRVLLAGRPAIAALESLDQQNLLSRLLPEWAPVRSKPQRNAYHRFTVDRHLLEAAVHAASISDRVERPDLLVVGALLHDIGKGYPGDHTEVGVDLVARIGARMGFTRRDTDVLVAMVRHHLLLPDAATRRDLDDPVTIEKVAEAVGDVGTLTLLGALAEADGLATGSSAWGPWKAGLVSELVNRTAAHLEGKPLPKGSGWVTEGHHRLMEEVRESGRPAVVLDPPQVTVAAADRPGLLASVAGILALHGLDVRSADATSAEGVAVEVFTVEVPRGSWPDSARLREDLDAVLADRFELEDRLAARAEAYAGERRPWSARTVSPHVVTDNDASASSTVLELRAPDEVGLLHRVTQALFDCALDVVSARVSTIGSEVVDAFYVRTAGGEKVTDPAVLRTVEEAVNAAAN
jgi:[protein-PII] uridylyltransferase